MPSNAFSALLLFTVNYYLKNKYIYIEKNQSSRCKQSVCALLHVLSPVEFAPIKKTQQLFHI